MVEVVLIVWWVWVLMQDGGAAVLGADRAAVPPDAGNDAERCQFLFGSLLHRLNVRVSCARLRSCAGGVYLPAQLAADRELGRTLHAQAGGCLPARRRNAAVHDVR